MQRINVKENKISQEYAKKETLFGSSVKEPNRVSLLSGINGRWQFPPDPRLPVATVKAA